MIDLESIRDHCLSLPGSITEEFPFDEEVLVFKLYGKIFLLTNVNELPLAVNLKCDPERAIELRERYPAVRPGYHMHKRMWNTVTIDGSLPERLVYEMIGHSYEEVAKKLPKKTREKKEQRKSKKSKGRIPGKERNKSTSKK